MSPTVKDYPTGINNPDHVGSTLRDVSEHAASQSKTMRDNLTDAAGDAAAMLKEKGAEFAEGAQGLASDVKGRFQDRIDEQKDAGADYVARLAEAMRRAAREFEQDMPIAAKYIGVAASGVDDYAEKFRGGNLTDLIDGTKAFAKRQPTAFLGLTFLAGFGLVRFLKSSSANSNERTDAPSPYDGERTAQGTPHSSRR